MAKDQFQSIIPLPGYGAVKFTTQFYYTPSGRSIQKIGIVPDIIVEQAKIETIAQGQAYNESSLKNSLNNPNQKPEQTENPTNPAQQGQRQLQPLPRQLIINCSAQLTYCRDYP